MTYGPIQLVVIAFPRSELPTEVVEQFRKARDAGTVRLISRTFVAKDAEGRISQLKRSDLTDEEAVELARLAGALFGFGYTGEAGVAGALLGADLGELAAEAGEFGLNRGAIDQVAAEIPPDSAAMIALFEHLWAIPIRQAVRAAGGIVLASGFVTAEMLVAAGAALAAEEEAAEAAAPEERSA